MRNCQNSSSSDAGECICLTRSRRMQVFLGRLLESIFMRHVRSICMASIAVLYDRWDLSFYLGDF